MLIPRATRLLTTIAGIGLLTSAVRADDTVLDSRMYHDPELPEPKIVRVYPENLLPVWLIALRRPEADYQSRAALSIVLAHREGIQGLERAIDPLLQALSRLDSLAEANPAWSTGQRQTGSSSKFLVQLAIARALIELDARQTAPQLFQLTQTDDRRLRDVIEPALARWGFRPAIAVWLKRLRQPDVNSADLLLAIRGLAVLRETEAASSLKELVDSAQMSWPLRLEASRALGQMQTSGLESDAKKLVMVSGSPASSAQLAAAWLLRHHQGDQAVSLLQTLGRDNEPAVVQIALERLLEVGAKLALPAMEPALVSPDAKVRLLGIETAFREATVERISLLADRLDDEHPDVRVKARQVLHQLAAQSKFKEAVIQQGMRILAGENWRGLEQATILLAQLDHKPATKRLSQLLDFERPEVFVAAGWALRKLDVPETLDSALNRIQSVRRTAESRGNTPRPEGISEAWDLQVSHLAQFMGQRRYPPAETALRAFVPRTPKGEILGQESRAASIWALGLFLEGKPEKGLVQQLEQRLNDIPHPMDPGEDPRVRRMSAITLGRMKSKESLKSLRRYFIPKPTLDAVSLACGWAIWQNTGEPLPPPGTVEFPGGIFKNWLRALPERKSKG
jgi:HEAT repeat protein